MSRFPGAVTRPASRMTHPVAPSRPTMSSSRGNLAGSFQDWRLELFCKTEEELQNVSKFLSSHNISRINLTNKTHAEPLLERISLLKAALPQLHMCVHYSMKFNYHRSRDPCFQSFKQFCSAVSSIDPLTQVLLVTGSGRRQNDSLQMLQLAAKQKSFPSIPLFVAFNPYLPDLESFTREKRRLREKLLTNMVSGVYLQIGTDLDRLQDGLKFLQSLKSELQADEGDNFFVYASMFLPSKRLLAQMRFRPWNGVFLSEEYLSSVEAAERISKDILGIYHEYGVIPLVETSVQSTAELENMYRLLGSCTQTE